jgi:hypothetical protein
MNGDIIFEMAKKELIDVIANTTLANLSSSKELVLAYYSFFEQIVNLEKLRSTHFAGETSSPAEKSAAGLGNPETQEKKSGESNVDNTVSACESEEPESGETQPPKISRERPMYLFERKIRGGFVPEIEGFVPEGVVRRLGLSHHDYIYANRVVYFGNKMRYQYELAQKTNAPDPPDRVQFNYCPVEVQDGMFVVKKSWESDSEIRIDEVPYVVLLNEEDIREFNIKEGDIIDIAFPMQRPEKNKILWKHEIGGTEAGESIAPKHSPARKKEDVESFREEQQIDAESLKDMNILVIGNEPLKPLYKLSIEQRGGNFFWADAKDDYETFKSLVKKMDLVIFLLKVSGHTGMKQIKQLCKEYNVPFKTTFSTGISSVVRISEENSKVEVAE